MFFNTSFGIDFRENHLILTFLKKTLRKIQLIDYGIYQLPPLMQKDERETQIIGLINAFISRNKIRKDKVIISVPRESVIIRFIRLPISTKENLRKVLEYESPKYIPFEKNEVYFDYHILKEDKEWLNLFAVFVKKSEIDSFLSMLKKIGIYPLSIQIPSTSALNLFFYNKNRANQNSVLLELGDSFFEINLIDQKNEWKDSFHLPIQKGEKESRIITAFKQLGIFGHSSQDSTIFVYGLGINEEILNNLKKADKIKKVLTPPMNKIEIKKTISFPFQLYSSIGIPLKGLISPKVDINLLPMELRKKVRQIWRPLFFCFIVLSLILSITWPVGLFWNYKKELNQINNEINKRRPDVEAINNLQKQKEKLKKDLLELEKIRGQEVSKILILKELTQILPSTVWIWNLKYKGKEIEISGYADSASDLISLLDKSPLFEKVEFLSPVTKERQIGIEGGKEKERFKIKAKIEGRI